ncbi:MAG: hypothetical protein K0Q73_3782 [Paenibacillus sp.]|nr:hypothetical protein [Paenibacillus sp.]
MELLEAFHVYYLTKVLYDDVYIEPHAHHYYQLICVLKGEGEIRISDRTYRCKPMQLVFVQRNATHAIYGQDMVTFECKFVMKDERYDAWLATLPPVLEDKDKTVCEAVRDIDREIKQDIPFRDETIKLDLLKIFICLLRYASGERRGDASPAKKPFPQAATHPLDAVFAYMERHLKQSITVRQLADIANVEYKYFSTLFKKRYGVGPKQYFNRLRIEAVKQLLLHTESTISQIAEQTGFDRIHALDSMFLRYERMTPTQFRKYATDMYTLHMNAKPTILTRPVFRPNRRVKTNYAKS